MKKAIIFDFDGVIADSVKIKSEGFYDLYIEYGKEIAQKVLLHHLDNGGISRFEKIKYYHSNFLGVSLNSIELENLCNHFSNRIIQNVINSPFIPGAIDFLEKYYKDFDLFVVTGTPFKEIEYVILEKNIHKYFRKLYGSPEDKITLTKKLLFDYNYNSNDLVFVGDALDDYKAAIENRIDFILVENDDNSKLFQNINTIKIPNLINLHNKISNIKI